METTNTTLATPEVGAELKCIVCAWSKPWGIFDSETGAAVCVDCRDKARDIPEGCALVAYDTGDGWYLGVRDSRDNEVAMLEWPKSWPETMSANRLREIGFQVA